MWVPLEQPRDEVARDLLRRIRGRAKFLVDENLGDEVPSAIRALGFNVKFVPDMGLRGYDDEAVLARAWAERRILLTHDRDFLDDRRFPFHRNPGIVVLPGGDGRGHALVRALAKTLDLIGHCRNLFPSAKIEISAEGNWNVRHLDKEQGLVVHTRLRFGPHGEVLSWKADD